MPVSSFLHCRVLRQDRNSPWQQMAVQAAAPAEGPDQQQQQHGSPGGQSPGRHQQQQSQYSDLLLPATDPLIQRCLQALQLSGSADGGSAVGGSSSSGGEGFASWMQRALGLEDAESSQNNVWLPTRCLQLLETLHAAVPRHSLIAADFDALPDIKLPGRNAPLVSGRGEGGSVQDYSSTLVPWGTADIFFPTDFDGLCQLYAAAAAQQTVQRQRLSSSHSSTAEFMSAFGESKRTRTLSGFNPLLQDWQNTRIFVGQAA